MMAQRLRFPSVAMPHSPPWSFIMLLIRRKTPVRARAQTNRDSRVSYPVE